MRNFIRSSSKCFSKVFQSKTFNSNPHHYHHHGMNPRVIYCFMFRPESQGELLDTTIEMMLDNDLSMELDVVFSNAFTIDTKCNCKSACLTKKCVCREKNIKCPPFMAIAPLYWFFVNPPTLKSQIFQ